jgi:hypothetical protein
MKGKLLFVHIVLLAACVFAENITDEVLSFKISLYMQGTNEDALSYLYEYRNALNSKNMGEEDRLFAENVLLVEESNFLSRSEENEKQIYLKMNEQSVKCDSFMQGKRTSALNSHFLVSFADLKSRLLKFVPSNQMYRESSAAKGLYLAAIKNDKKSAYALMGYAMWQFFAPLIAGGGNNAALRNMSQALKNSSDDRERYFILVYRSQILFSMNRKSACVNDLNEAHALFPAERFTVSIKEQNERNKTLFD